MFLIYPWLRMCKCCRCINLDDREGEKRSTRKMQKKREREKRVAGNRHRDFQRRLDEKKIKEEEDWLERSGLHDYLDGHNDMGSNTGKSKKEGMYILIFSFR
jgi:hypothetical protein